MDLDLWDCSGRVKLSEFHRTDLVICSHSREEKTLSYNRINMIDPLCVMNFIFVTVLEQKHPYPLHVYTGGLCHCHTLHESSVRFRGVRSTLSILCYFLRENPVSKQCRP